MIKLKLDAHSLAAQLLEFYHQPPLTKVYILAKALLERDTRNKRARLIHGLGRAAHAIRNTRFLSR